MSEGLEIIKIENVTRCIR